MNKRDKKPKLNIAEWLSLVPGRSYTVFIILILIIFIQSLKFGYTHCDDLGLVEAKELKLSNIKLIFEKGVFYFTGAIDKDPYYRPMQNLVYATGKIAGEKNVAIQHLISILLHFIASSLLFNFLIVIGYRKTISFIATCIFIIHPLLVQAVVWIPGLGELLITIFLLSSFIYLVKFLENIKIKLLQLFLSILFFFAALLSKESAIGFIPVAFMYALFVNKNKERIFLKLMLFAAGLIPVLISWYLLRENAVGQHAVITPSALSYSLFNNGKFLFYYIGEIFLPYHLSPLQSPLDSNILPGIITVFILLVFWIFIKAKRNRMLLLFGLLWYTAFLLPTLFLSNPAFEFYSYNHRLYLPLIGFFIVILEIFAFESKRYNVKILSAILISFSTGLLFLSFNYSKAFKNKYTFYKAVIENSPHSYRAYESLGRIYYDEKKCTEAMELFKKASLLQPHLQVYYGLIANTYNACIGDLSMAIQWFQKTIAFDSTSNIAANSACSLGNIYYLSFKDTSTAKIWYKKAIEIDSSQAFPMYMLGNLYSDLTDTAEYWYNKALLKDSLSSVALNGLGIIEFNRKNYKKAINLITKATRNNSTDIQLLKNLMLCYRAINDFNTTKKFAQEYENRGGIIPDDIAEYIKER